MSNVRFHDFKLKMLHFNQWGIHPLLQINLNRTFTDINLQARIGLFSNILRFT